jgi:ribonuclease HI
MKPAFDSIVYCDASVRNDHHGIGICLLDAQGRLVRRASKRLVPVGRNNTEVEAVAVLEAASMAIKRGAKAVRIYTDSLSLVSAVRSGRAKSRVIRAFVQRVKELRLRIKLSIKWVRGHTGHRWNTLCDYLAKNAKWTLFERLAIRLNQSVSLRKLRLVS